MKKIYLHLLLMPFLSLIIHSTFAFDFPNESKVYIPKSDIGFSTQYNAPSLYNSGKAVLTFDDGPNEKTTPIVLDTLQRLNQKATFFVLGENITARTIPIIERMYKEGHLVGIHGYNHTNANDLSETEFKTMFKTTLKKLIRIQQNTGIFQKEVYYRFPGGNYGGNSNYHHFNALRELSEELYHENCINFVFWNIETSDWLPSIQPYQIITNIISHFKGGTFITHQKFGDEIMVLTKKEITKPPRGGVILLHDVKEKTAHALEWLLDHMRQNQIWIMPLNKVKEFSFAGKKCELIKY